MILDDPRLAIWLEHHAEVADDSPEATVAPLLASFRAVLDPGESPTQILVRDPQGQVLAVLTPYQTERLRVAEVVSPPLRRAEREPWLTFALSAQEELGCMVPAEAALHLHFDAAPWRSTPRLCQLILDYSAARELLRRELAPNPRCRKLGEFLPVVQRIAREATLDLPFGVLATAIDSQTPDKGFDLNVQGVVQRFPRQPTLEVRCLPMLLECDTILQRLDFVETFLANVARAADARLASAAKG